ncbi:5-methylcytosine restriction system specificity protein McrC [Geminocystis sp. CENA526]|uniref:5-methylcytosine restriction system specificity protein McrC n=1 Tax=Geminocystis sp. CENA526 TaxID=1355871 RepID=UPI003D6DCA41
MKILKIKSGTKIWVDNSELNDLNILLKSLNSDYLLDANYLIIPQGYVGKIITKNLEIIIEPSISYLTNIDYLRLILNDKLADSQNNSLSYDKNIDISKFIIDQFLDNLQKLVKQGIPPQYKNTQIISQYLQGNVNFFESFLRIKLGIEPYFITYTQKIEMDYFAMRVIKKAYQKLIANFPNYQQFEITKTLDYITNESIRVERLKNIRLNFNKQEKYLANAFEFACLILQNMSYKNIGNDLSFSLIINSNLLFERYMVNFLQQSFPNDIFKYKDSIKVANYKKQNQEQISIEPDIVYQGSHTVIIDIKNKNFDRAVINADFYQIYTYCKALNSDTGVLIYPYYQNIEPVIINPIFDEKIRIYGLGIDITNFLISDIKKAQSYFRENIGEIFKYG